MPEEVFIIVVLAIIAGTVSGVLKQIFSYLKNRQASQVSGTSLTSSELKAMMQEAVELAMAPLADRLDAIEERLPVDTDLRLPVARHDGRIDNSLLDNREGIDPDRERAEVLRRRSRT